MTYEELLLHSKDMHQVERGNCKGKFSYKMHWLVPGKASRDGLLFLHDDATVEKTVDASPHGEYAEIFVEELFIQNLVGATSEEELMDLEASFFPFHV